MTSTLPCCCLPCNLLLLNLATNLTLNFKMKLFCSEPEILPKDQRGVHRGCHHSSVDSSVPSILPPQVWAPSTPTTLFSMYKAQIVCLSLELECEKNENEQKEAGIGPFFKEVFINILLLPGQVVFVDEHRHFHFINRKLRYSTLTTTIILFA